MAVVIPVRTRRAADDAIRVRLDGPEYTLKLQWNTRIGYWSLSLFTADGTPLFEGLRLVVGVNMLRQFVGENFPPGALVAVDTQGKDEDPGRFDLVDNRVQIVYLTAEDVAGG